MTTTKELREELQYIADRIAHAEEWGKTGPRHDAKIEVSDHLATILDALKRLEKCEVVCFQVTQCGDCCEVCAREAREALGETP